MSQSEMSDQTSIHGILAAGLANPSLILAWRRDPESIRALGLEPGELDLDKLWKFVGLNTKVRYNPVRTILPHTFKLMGRLSLEIEIFAEFALDATQLRNEGRGSLEEKTDALYEFLENWLDEDRLEHVAIWDMIRHETAMLELQKLVSAGVPCENPAVVSASNPRQQDIPHICGELRLHQMSFSPQEISDLLFQKNCDLASLQREERWFGYWWDGESASIRVLSLPLVGYYILSLTDGDLSLGQIGEQLGCGENGLPWSDLFEVIQRFTEAGLLSLQPGDGR